MRRVPARVAAVERTIAEDVQRLTPAVQEQSAHAVWLWGRGFQLCQSSFPNAMTTEEKTLPGEVPPPSFLLRSEVLGPALAVIASFAITAAFQGWARPGEGARAFVDLVLFLQVHRAEDLIVAVLLWPLSYIMSLWFFRLTGKLTSSRIAQYLCTILLLVILLQIVLACVFYPTGI